MTSARRTNTVVAQCIFAVFSIIFFCSTVGVMNSVDAPQYAVTQAMVQRRVTYINEFAQYIWPDFAEHDGKLYSEREIGLSLLAIPPYILARSLTSYSVPPYGSVNYPGITWESTTEALTYGFMSFVPAIGLVFFFYIARHLRTSIHLSLLSTIAVGLGTLYWRYSSSFVRQPFIAAGYLFLIFMMFSAKKYQTYKPIVIGLVTGFLIISDHVGTIAAVVLALGCIIAYRTHFRQFFKLFILFVSVPILYFFLYNYISFHHILVTSRQYSRIPAIRDPRNVFIATPNSLFFNLFSLEPLPQSSLDYLQRFPDIYTEFKANMQWASFHQYKGILIQSPFLFAALFGFIFIGKENRRNILFILTAAVLYFIPGSLLFVYYNPTAYDTRYVLPVAVLLSIGLPVILEKLKNARSTLFHHLGNDIVFILIGLSVLFGWESEITNFAPHITGETRLLPDMLQYPLTSISNISANFPVLFEQTFPNRYNLSLALLCVLVILLVWSIFSYNEDER